MCHQVPTAKASRLAQLVERETVNLEANGSIPLARAFLVREDNFIRAYHNHSGPPFILLPSAIDQSGRRRRLP